MVTQLIKCSNNLALPPVEKKIFIDLDLKITQIKKHLRDEFNLDHTKFVIFFEDNTKWNRLNDSDIPSKFGFRGDIKQIDIKKQIDLTNFYKKFKKNSSEIINYPYGVLHVSQLDAETTKQKLVDVTNSFLQQALDDPSNVSFSIPSRGGDNIGFDEDSELVLLGKQKIARQFRNLSSVKSVQQLTELMKILHEQLNRGIHSAKRDIYYQAVNIFEKQDTSDSLIEDIGAMLQVTRSSMNVTASAKGNVVGHIEFEEQGNYKDCTKQGNSVQISPNIDDYTKMQSDAEFVLVIEKDAVFNRLSEDKFYNYVPSILVTAKGQPDMATRMFLKKINDELNLPILAIMDADVYGFEILRVYSVGSKALSFEAANLAVPNIQWLGLLPSDLREDSGFGIPKDTHIKMTKSDERRIKLLLDEEFVKRKPKWREQIEILLQDGIKAEIQALNAQDPQYITNHYLPRKLEEGDFI